MGKRKRSRNRPMTKTKLESVVPEIDQKPKRKRGRPRKIVVVEEEGEEKVREWEEDLGGDLKEKIDGDVPQEGVERKAPDGGGEDQNNELQSEENSKPKSKGRRKGKPHKST